ncbi:MAG: 2-isopropylmalate synthase [Candidatus Azobacteroides sp.]|nr:2-isopropylmalate synthase [Candidatus Azobacteroides sp.]
MDTTLRDGEQTSGVSFATEEKLSVVSLLLEELNVDRIEIASARVSSGEFEAVRKVAEWAEKRGHIEKIEVLGFIDGEESLQWTRKAGCRVLNLLCKGSLKHVTEQLRKTPEEHTKDILTVIEKAQEMGISVNIYLEDWSNGMVNSPDYVFFMMEELKGLPIKRFMLPDTLGILSPMQTADFCSQMTTRYPELHFDFHAHNDYDLAVANVLMAVEAGVKGIHTTVNGLGERAGNAPLSSVLAVLHDQLKVKTHISEENINKVSRVIETFSGIRIPANKPIIGENVFTQCAGIHADGDKKNNLYFNDLLPERFGRMREYALGKMSGKANIQKNLEALGIEMDESAMRKVTDRIIELGDKKQIVTQEDLPYIISDVLKQDIQSAKIKMLDYALHVSKGLRPTATVKLEVNGETYEVTAAGDGQYNAFTKALWKIYNRLGKASPNLTDYVVTIPPGGRTDALVQTTITWNFKGKEFKTNGLDPDQTEAAIKATEKMLNIIEDME